MQFSELVPCISQNLFNGASGSGNHGKKHMAVVSQMLMYIQTICTFYLISIVHQNVCFFSIFKHLLPYFLVAVNFYYYLGLKLA